MRLFAAIAILACFCAPAFATLAVNIDFDSNPSAAPALPDTYGAASGQAGSWNRVGLGITNALLDTTGSASSVNIQVVASSDTGNAGGLPSGNDQFLTWDNFFTSLAVGPWTVTIEGLDLVEYDVYVYAPMNTGVRSGVLRINGESVPQVAGSVFGTLVEGDSWVVAEDVAADGGIIHLRGVADQGNFSGLAGLQLVPNAGTTAAPTSAFPGINRVPEPSAMLMGSLLSLVLAAKRTR